MPPCPSSIGRRTGQIECRWESQRGTGREQPSSVASATLANSVYQLVRVFRIKPLAEGSRTHDIHEQDSDLPKDLIVLLQTRERGPHRR